MKYRCQVCSATEWRGLFTENPFSMKYAVFHGLAIGVVSISIKILFSKAAKPLEGFAGGLLSLLLGGLFLLIIYSAAIFIETMVVCARGCPKCSSALLKLSK